jgi:hypothetical protein
MAIAQWKNCVYRPLRTIARWLNEALAYQAAQPRTELARAQSSVANVGRGQAATPFKTAFTQGAIKAQDRINADELQRMEEDRVRRRGLREAATPLQIEPEATANAARTASMSSPANVESTPVMDMFFCLDNLLAIRAEVEILLSKISPIIMQRTTSKRLPTRQTLSSRLD